MAEKIAVDPERMEAVAGKFQQEAETIRSLIQACRGKIDALGGYWEGAAESKFMGQYSSAEAQLQKVPELLTNVQNELKAIASRFRAADNA